MKKFRVTVNGTAYEVEIEEIGVVTDNLRVPPRAPETAAFVAAPALKHISGARNISPLLLDQAGTITSPMPGMINEVRVKIGEQVQAGDVLFVLEAMKMENLIKADIAGVVKEIRAVKGHAVNSGDTLAVIS